MIQANGIYTIHSHRGGHRTFKLLTRHGTRELFALTGPDNSNHKNYRLVGYEKDGFLYPAEGIRGSITASIIRLLEAKLKGTGGHKWADRCDLLESRTCRRCNRKLTTPRSILLGIGPICEDLEEQCYDSQIWA